MFRVSYAKDCRCPYWATVDGNVYDEEIDGKKYYSALNGMLNPLLGLSQFISFFSFLDWAL